MRRVVGAACLILLAVHPSGEVAAQQTTGDDVRERAFGRRPARSGEIRVPLVVGRRPLGEVTVLAADDPQRSAVRFDDFDRIIGPYADPELMARIEAARDGRGFVPLAALRAAGLGARIDEQSVSLVIDIPAEQRRLQTLALRGRAPEIGRNGLNPPADLSSYLNQRSGVDGLHGSAGGTPAGRQPINAAFETGTNVYGTVFEGAFSYSEAGTRAWQRNDFRLVRDDPENAMRYSVGDLSYPVTGLQGFQSMAGVSIARNFDLQPYRLFVPAGQRQFLLQNDSRVEVFVNGRRDDTLTLGAGRYDLRNFPFAQGTNDVQLRITDSVGRVNIVDIPFFFSVDLLGEGVHQFAYNVGAVSRDDRGLRHYGGGPPAFSALHRYGLSEWLTVGANAQGSGDGQMIGGEISATSGLGAFRIDVGGSRSPAGADLAGRFIYSYVQPETLETRLTSVTASVGYTGREFATLGVANPNNPVGLDLSLRYNFSLPYDLVAGIGGSYEFGRGTRDTNSVSMSLRQIVSETLTTSVELSRIVDTTGREDYRMFVNLTLLLDRPRQFIQSSFDTERQTARLDYQYLSDYDVLEPRASASIARSRGDAYDFSGEIDYNGYRYESAVFHDETLPRGNEAATRRSGVRFGTALAYADGHLTLSRPIGDSFVLVVPHPTLADQRIGAEGTQGRYRAEVDALGPAAISNLASYQVRTINVAVPDLPIGLEVGRDIFQVQPGYRSGTVLTVGTAATVLLDGTLVDAAGEPLPLLAGTARPVGIDGAEPVEFFTNRAGRFRADGIQPGAYDLVFRGYPAAVRIEVPAGTVGLFRVGRITIRETP